MKHYLLLVFFFCCCLRIYGNEMKDFNQTEYDDDVWPVSTTIAPQTTSTTTKEPEEICICEYNSDLEKAGVFLRESVKQTQIRLAEPFRDAIAYTSTEKMILVNVAKYQTLHEIEKNYANLLNHTDFMKSFDEFMNVLSRMLVDEKHISSAGIKHEVTTALHRFLRHIVPTTFMCITFGKCRSVPLNYMDCMNKNTENWKEYLGEGPEKMAIAVADTIYRYRKTESLLMDMHVQLMNAQNRTVTEHCIESLANISCECKKKQQICEHNSLCWKTRNACFGQFNLEWDAKLFLMKNLTAGYSKNNGFLANFLKIKKSLNDGFRHLTERNSAVYAEHLTKSCGVPSEMHYHSKINDYKLISPPKFRSKAELAVRELQLSMKTWDKVNENTCNINRHESLNPACQNRVNDTTTRDIENEMEMPRTKDVRPRPMIEWMENKKKKEQERLEASGNPANWDDEDSYVYDEGSGSGVPEDMETASHPKSVIQAGRDDSKTAGHPTSGNPRGPTVLISDYNPTAPDSALRANAISAILTVLIVHLLV